MEDVTKWGDYEVYVLHEGKERSHVYVVEWGTTTYVDNSELTTEELDQ
ncbi:hypothetical protein [Bacillus paranthracis]|nr:hypothetical protein [Bacillus paranthracis]